MPHNNLVDPFGVNSLPGEPGQIEGTIECKKEKVAGSVTGPKTTEWQAEYTGCKSSTGKCNTFSRPPGHIETEKLTSELVFLNAAKTVAVIEVEGNGPVGGKFSNDGLLAQYECGPSGPPHMNVDVYGGILAPVTGDIEEAQKTTTYTAAEGPLHLQAFTYVEAYEPKGNPGTNEEAAKGWWEAEEASLPNVFTKPVMLESDATGAISSDVPCTQNGVTADKGEAMGISL